MAVMTATEEHGSETRGIPRRLWDQLRADPARAPEHIALAAAEIHGPAAAGWLAEREAHRSRPPVTHARDAVRRHAHLARVTGAATGLGGWTTMALDLAGVAWIQSRMVFFVAAAYGWDPRDPMRPAELLVLQGVYDDPYAAREALDGTGQTLAAAYAGSLSGGSEPLVGRLVRLVGGHAAQHLGGKVIPGLASIVGSISNARDTKDLGRRAMEFYGGRTA